MRKNIVNTTVSKLLEHNQDLRDDDKKLILAVYRDLGLELTDHQERVMLTLPAQESITRLRRKLQSDGLYPASKGVRKFREQKAMVVEQNAPTASSERLEQVLDNDQLILEGLVL